MTEFKEEQLTVAPDGRPAAAQLRWRQDFPIDMPEDAYIARRDFTKFMVLTSLAFTAGQFWIVGQNSLRRREGKPAGRLIARVDDIPVGGVVRFAYPEEQDKCVLVRLDEQTFAAYNQACTHLSCGVVPEPDKNRLRCPCHEGLFDLATGRPIAGPPRRPLTRVQIEISGGEIYATGVELRTV